MFPKVSLADRGDINLTCINLKSALFGRKYTPLNFKLEATAFHYFDDNKDKFQTIKSREIKKHF